MLFRQYLEAKQLKIIGCLSMAGIAIFLLVSCATSPGGPIIRTSDADGFGELAAGCQNISPLTPSLYYETDYYLSTWGSAALEGVQSGLQSGLKVDPDDDAKERFTKEFSAVVIARVLGYDGSLPPKDLYCMHYETSPEQLAEFVQDILPILQNEISDGTLQKGVFKTDFYDREHAAAKWRDRYGIHVRPTDDGTADVTVYRDLWISRLDEPYVRARSNGGNEAWILQSLSYKLASVQQD
jgi:hypothetical protein